MTIPVTLAMIAKDEEQDLPFCLDSVKGLVDDIVLVDSGSSDKTMEVAKKYGARVFQREFDSFANQKNYAISLAQNEWVLHLDPDERLTPELKEEIEKLFTPNRIKTDAFEIPFTNYFLGHEMLYSGLNGEKHIRLFKKGKSYFGGGLLHEGVRVTGKTDELIERIEHYSYPDMEEYLVKFNSYTSLAAEKMRQSGKKFHCWNLLTPPLEFLKRYVLRLGFLDGVAGLAWSGASAFYVFVKHIKLWQLEREAEQDND